MSEYQGNAHPNPNGNNQNNPYLNEKPSENKPIENQQQLFTPPRQSVVIGPKKDYSPAGLTYFQPPAEFKPQEEDRVETPSADLLNQQEDFLPDSIPPPVPANALPPRETEQMQTVYLPRQRNTLPANNLPPRETEQKQTTYIPKQRNTLPAKYPIQAIKEESKEPSKSVSKSIKSEKFVPHTFRQEDGRISHTMSLPPNNSFGPRGTPNFQAFSVMPYPNQNFDHQAQRLSNTSQFTSITIGHKYENHNRINQFGNRFISHQTTQHTVNKFSNHQPFIKENIIEKPVEIIKEKRVRVEKFVDVPYDVIVEKPIEKIIEKEIQIEKLKEVQVKKIVEVPVEKIIDVPYEKVVEIPREVIKRVEIPVEKVVERKVTVPVENIIYHDNYVNCNLENLHQYPNAEILPAEVVFHEQERVVERPVYKDNIIERVVDVPIERIIEVPIERLIHKPVEQVVERPVYIENIIEKTVEIPIENIVEKPVEQIIENPIYIENIIEKPVPIEVLREETVEVPVERIIDNPIIIENVIEKPVELIKENPVPIEQVIEVPIPVRIDLEIPVNEAIPQNYNIIREVPIQVDLVRKQPIEYLVTKKNPVPVESLIEVDMPVPNVQVHEKIIQRPVQWERTVQRAVPVEKIVEVEVERVTENAVYRENVTQIPVQFDRVIEQKYEVLVPNVVEIPVEKVISVPVRTISKQPQEHMSYWEKDVNVRTTVVQPVEGMVHEEHVHVNDHVLLQKTTENAEKIAQLAAENSALLKEKHQLNVDHTPAFNRMQEKNAMMKAELSELDSRLRVIGQDKERLGQSLASRTVQHLTYVVPDPQVGPLKHELSGLLNENKGLVRQAATHGERNAMGFQSGIISSIGHVSNHPHLIN